MTNGMKTCLWFDGQAEDAMNFYVNLFPNSEAGTVVRNPESAPDQPGAVMVANWRMLGQEFQGLNGGPMHTFSEATSFVIECADQKEVDRYWDALTADGGEEGRCAWCKDKFGVSWQIVPTRLNELLSDPATAGKVAPAMMGMNKIIIADLEAAAGE